VSVSVSGVNVSPRSHHAYCVMSARMAAPASSMHNFNGAPRFGELVHVFLCCVVSVAPIDFPVRGMSAHLTLCCVVRVAHLTLMHASWICCACVCRDTTHQTPDKHRNSHTKSPNRDQHQTETNTQTETQTSNFCSCFQRWNSERKYVGLHAPHTLDQNLNVENMNKSLMSVCVSFCVCVCCVSNWCRVSLCLSGVVVGVSAGGMGRCAEEGRGGMGRDGGRGKLTHLTLCCTVRVARLTLMHAMRMCAKTRDTRHQTQIHRRDHRTEIHTRQRKTTETETQTSNFCSCFQRVENMNKSLMEIARLNEHHVHQTFVHVFNALKT
jgi:hypothetical protein